MNLPSKAWLTQKNGLWRIIIPNKNINPNLRLYSGCMQLEFPAQIVPATRNNVKGAQRISYIMNNDQSIRIGPTIGILSVAANNRLLGNRANFIDIINAGKQFGALVFVFTPDDIDWNQKQIHGRFYNSQRKQWFKYPVPYPDVIYNRIPNRKYEATPEIKASLHKLQHIPNLHLFNPHFFNKWEIYQIIQASHLHTYLPETILLTSPQALEQLLHKHKSVFLKPSEDKAGKGIYLLSQIGGTINLSSSFDGSKVSYQTTRIDELWHWLQPKIANRSYIIQQAIPLLTHGESPFDVRVLVQKNMGGEWEVSGVGYRVAGKDSITTHVPQGGKIINKATALVPNFGLTESESIFQSIKQIATEIAQTLERHYQQLGEMSMDLGLTKEGRIWFFEANAKPMKFDEPEIRRTSLQRIIEYSMYLSRFAQ